MNPRSLLDQVAVYPVNEEWHSRCYNGLLRELILWANHYSNFFDWMKRHVFFPWWYQTQSKSSGDWPFAASYILQSLPERRMTNTKLEFWHDGASKWWCTLRLFVHFEWRTNASHRKTNASISRDIKLFLSYPRSPTSCSFGDSLKVLCRS